VAMQQRRQGNARRPMAAVFMSVFSLSISPMGGYERSKKRFKDASSTALAD